MTVWCHLPTIFRRRSVLRIAGLVALCVALVTTFIFSHVSYAAAGINKTLNFQARLLTASGAVVPDGHYNVQFKIYQDGAGAVAGNSGGTLVWTETYINNDGTSGVEVRNGFMSVTLGSVTPFGTNVDWNQDTLWLSMNVAGSAASCTTFGSGSCVADGEMLPMKRITSVPYAMNAGMLGGKTASDFLQNTASLQTGSAWLSGSVRSDTSLFAPIIDTATAGALSIGTTNASSIVIGAASVDTIIQGNLQTNNLDTDSATTLNIGSTNATNINLNQNVTIAEGKSLTIAGGETATRPANPSEGALYYDTTTKQLLVYSNGKWQNNGQTTSLLVAASNSTQSDKDSARYVANGEDSSGVGRGAIDGDQVQINTALNEAAASGGGTVYLLPGTYTIDAPISVPNNTTLAGSGMTTVVQLGNFGATSVDIQMITNEDHTTGEGIVIQNMLLDGRSSLNTSGWQVGVYLNGVGATGDTPRENAKVTNMAIRNMHNEGISVVGSSTGNIITDNTVFNTYRGIILGTSQNNIVSRNIVQNSTGGGIYLLDNATYNTVANNSVVGNASCGICLDTANNNTIDANTIHNSGGSEQNNGIYLVAGASNNLITNNTVTDTAATTNYALHINNATSSANYLANNMLNDGSIDDNGTDTIYGGQVDANGSYMIQPTGSISLLADTIVSGTISATSLQGNNFDTETATALNIGSVNATSIHLNQNTTVNANLTITGNVSYTPGGNFAIVGTSNDVNFGTGTIFRLTGVSDQTITGIAGGTDGRTITLMNAAAQAAALANNSASSASGNRIITGTGNALSIAAGASVSLVYDGTSTVWRVVGTISGSQSGGSYVSLQPGTPLADTGNLSVTGSGNFGGGVNIQTASDITNAFLVQNSNSEQLLNVDSISGVTTIGGLTTAADPLAYDFETASQLNELTQSGNTNWARDSTTRHGGTYSISSGSILDDQSSAVSRAVTVSGGSTVSFWWRVSSETNWDYLFFCVDQTTASSCSSNYVSRISGETSWAQVTTTLPAGTHTLMWAYVKDEGTSSGQDKGWIDDIYIENAVKATTNGTLEITGNSSTAFNVQDASGADVFTIDTMTSNVYVKGGLTISGGTTASRPTSPTEGMIYYDTATKQLLTYSNGKWQSDSKSATAIVAASDSSQADKDGAQYVADGTSDQAEINAALTAAAGGTVLLQKGTYTLNGAVTIPANTTLSGVGSGTIIKRIANSTTSWNMIGSEAASIVLQNLTIDGSSDTDTGTGNLVSTSYASGAVLRSLYLKNATGYAVVPGASNRVLDNSISDTGGVYFWNGPASITVSNNTFSNSNITVRGSNHVISNNTISGGIIDVSAVGVESTTGVTVSNNTITQATNSAIRLHGNASHIVVSGNTISGAESAAAEAGIELWEVSYVSVQNNTIFNNPSFTSSAIMLVGATNNTISSNSISNNGGSNAADGISLEDWNSATSDNNTIQNNSIYDTTGTGYAIDIETGTNGTVLSNNIYSGTGASAIRDNGTGTVYSGQTNSDGDYLLQPAGAIELLGDTNVTGTLAVTTLQTDTIDTVSTGTLHIGSTRASSISLDQNTVIAAGKSLTINGVTSVVTTSSTAFVIQDASNTVLFTADTNAQQVVIGSITNGVILSANGIQLKGTARNLKSIVLTPEYSGAVLDAQSDSVCASATNGTMTASYDTVNRMNYYTWTSTQSTNQCYNVVVQVPIPSDFSAWQSGSIMMRANNTSNTSYGIAIIDSNGSYDANYGSSYASPGALSTSWGNVATNVLSGTYTAGDYFTIKIRMSAKDSANLQLGNITLYYYGDK